jgi:hypothetical protein
MKAKLRLAGIVLITIAFVIVSSMALVVLLSPMPEYNYANYTGFRPPSWLFIIAQLLGLTGIVLIGLNNRQKKMLENNPPTPP